MPDEVLLKIRRAEKHIRELQEVLADFRNTNPYTVADKRDAKTGEIIVYITSTKPIPDDVPLIAGDAIHNLYSSLDYLAWQLVIAGGEEPNESAAFPISEHIPMNHNERKRYDNQARGMTDQVKQMIREMNPYRGQNNCFWRLHKLNNLNKHRTLLTVGFSTTSAAAWGDILDAGKINFGQALNQGSEVARFPAGSENHRDVRFTFDVAFNEPDADARSHTVDMDMQLFLRTVRRTVSKFDAYR